MLWSVPVSLLPADEVALLEAAPLTYAFDRATGQIPVGYHQLRHSRTLQRRDLDGAAGDLLAWRMHERSGLHVRAADVPLREGTVVLMRWTLGPFTVSIPCRVVEVVNEPGRRGFTYGTLLGHPESGEEQFLLEEQDDGGIRLTVSAFSRPASRLARLCGPAGRSAQWLMTKRYLGALDRP